MSISISYVCVFVQYHQMVLVWPTSLLVLPSFMRSRAHNKYSQSPKGRRHRLTRHKCIIHNSRDAVTVSAAVTT